MKPIVSIIMGSTSDLPILKKAADFLNQMEVPFEMNALSAHRTPLEVESFARGARDRGIKVIIAAAGMAAALPGVIAAMTPVPVIGIPINSTLSGMDALSDEGLAKRYEQYRSTLSQKIVNANAELKELKYDFKVD